MNRILAKFGPTLAGAAITNPGGLAYPMICAEHDTQPLREDSSAVTVPAPRVSVDGRGRHRNQAMGPWVDLLYS